MYIQYIKLKNWRNFKDIEVSIGQRAFLVGPNASGKSNFLDAFRFLKDIADSKGGGLQQAVRERGGISRIRCLAARTEPQIEIEVHLTEHPDTQPKWKYFISIVQEQRGRRQPIILKERVYKEDEMLLDRPDEADKQDEERKSQTNLEQINTNKSFRDIARFFESIEYSHLIPQLLKNPQHFSIINTDRDLFGSQFIENIIKTPSNSRISRLEKIENALHFALPQLKHLSDSIDEKGIPHLEAVYEHWRPNAGKQNEVEFSDGTLRLISLLWSLLDGNSLLLLEEPELSLHSGIIRKLPSFIWKIQSRKKRQVIISTHNYDLLSDKGIGGEEVLLLQPDAEGTQVKKASDDDTMKELLNSGFPISEAALPKTAPERINQLTLEL